MYKFIIALLLVTAAVSGQDYDTALGFYKEQKYNEALEAVNSIPEKGFEVFYLDAHIRMALKKFTSATVRMETAVKLKPEEIGPRVDMVRLLLRRGRPADALAFAERSNREIPDSVDLQLAQAHALLHNRKPLTALEIVEKLKSTQSGDYRPLLIEGTIYYTLKDYDKAEVSFTWAAAIDGDNLAVNNNLAIVYDKMAEAAAGKDTEKQKKYLEKAKMHLEKAQSISQHWAVERNLKRVNMLLEPEG